MKKSIFIALLGMSLAACNNDDLPAIADNDAETPLMENFRSEDEAIEIATKALNEFYPVTSRSGRDLSQMNVVLLNKPASRNSDITNPLYVVNFGNESGYAIISADKETEPLLAVTESGSITSLDNVDNPGLRLFLDGASKLEKDTTALKPFIPGLEDEIQIIRKDTIVHASYSEFLHTQVKWGQTYPEGLLCPNGCSGCVATAGAQALSCFRYPKTLTLSFPERSSDQISLDWSNLRRIIGNIIQPDYNIQLSSLCREIGYKINADYSEPYSTSANTTRLRNYLAESLPSNEFSVSDITYSKPVTNEVLGNGVIIMRGVEAEASVGHCWIIPGYEYKDYTVYVYSIDPETKQETQIKQYDKTDLYPYINWGWYGKDNGYFDINRLITSQANFTQNFYYFTIKTK